MHSISSLGAKEFPLKRCAGAILIGATLLGSKDFPPLAHTFPRPLMHIFGQADGQTPLAIAAVTIGDAAISAASLTPATAAKARPVVLISGCNHAHFSNGIVKTARGDLPTDTSIDASAEDIANALATFVAANAPGVNPDKANAAAKFLARETICSAMLLSSYAAVLGRIPLDKLYSHEISELGLTLARGTGAEMGYAANPLTAMLAHPGELRAAETFAVLLQRSLLHGLVPEDLADDISIAATVHTHPSTFTYSQATLLPPCGGEGDTYGAMAWSLQVHCLLERAERVGATPISTLAPVYALKLKSGAQVAAVLHAAGLMSQPSSRSAQEGEMTSAEVNNRVLRSAKKVMHPELLEEYEARGRPVTFTDKYVVGHGWPDKI